MSMNISLWSSALRPFTSSVPQWPLNCVQWYDYFFSRTSWKWNHAARCLWSGFFHRIDHILGHKSSLGKFGKVEIIPNIFSDHNAVRLDANYRRKTVKKSVWRHLIFNLFPPQVIQVAIKEKGGSLNVLVVIKFGGSGSWIISKASKKSSPPKWDRWVDT